MLRFVILRHTLPPHSDRASHWDFMLAVNDNGPLWTWELPDEPALEAHQFASRLPDHRRDYLTYEGPISQDRGFVRRWDNGEVVWREKSDAHLVADLHGAKLLARVTLDRDADALWFVRWEPLEREAS